MNPILADLDIRISTIESAADLTARQRLHLAKAAPTVAGPRSGPGSTLLNLVREFVNPRRYALRLVDARERPGVATRPAPRMTPVRNDAVTVFASRRVVQDTDLQPAA